MSERQRDHVKEYGRSLAVWKEKNLSDKVCHDCAAASAREKFRLEPDEQQAVDEWLDDRYPARKSKPDSKEPPSLFDDLPRAT